jgi:hypothetical protein
VVAPKARCTLGEMRLPSRFQITPGVGRAGLNLWDCIRQTLTAFIIWATMCMNGVLTGTTPTTTAVLPTEIRVDLTTAAAVPREVAPGGTTSRSVESRRARVSHQCSNTPITDSESCDPRSPKVAVVPRFVERIIVGMVIEFAYKPRAAAASRTA